MIKYLSFDLQGTLSASEFSDNFWRELLPEAYASRYDIDITEAKAQLGAEFKKIGTYDIRYYDDAYWAEELGFTTVDLIEDALPQPILDIDLMRFLKSLDIPKIIISTTTNAFIDYELGQNKTVFTRTFSCVDDFETGGKTREIFQKIAHELGVEPREILHIGDNDEMDIENARLAGVKALKYTGDTVACIADITKELRSAH